MCVCGVVRVYVTKTNTISNEIFYTCIQTSFPSVDVARVSDLNNGFVFDTVCILVSTVIRVVVGNGVVRIPAIVSAYLCALVTNQRVHHWNMINKSNNKYICLTTFLTHLFNGYIWVGHTFKRNVIWYVTDWYRSYIDRV